MLAPTAKVAAALLLAAMLADDSDIAALVLVLVLVLVLLLCVVAKKCWISCGRLCSACNL